MSEEYESEEIEVLEGLEAVRKRPGMYIGSTDQRGLHHMIYEVVDNSIDEAMAGYCDEITVEIHDDNSVTVSDNGRGIPVKPHPEYEASSVEVVMTRLHAGGKFDDNTYEISGGLHGVGVSVVNALSERFVVEVCRDGGRHRQVFEKGIPIDELERVEETDETGTMIHFEPDSEIFDTLTYDSGAISQKLRELSFLNNGVRLALTNEQTDDDEPYEAIFEYENGLIDFVEHLNENNEPLHEGFIEARGKQDGVKVEVVMQYTKETYQERIFGFANNINTHEGGTHITGFKSALTQKIKQYARNHDLLPDGVELTSNDIREGLTAIVSVLVPEPQFEGQTKTKLGNSEVRGVVQGLVGDRLQTFLEETPSVARDIVEHAVSNAKARQAAQEAKKVTRRKTALESTQLPGKLSDCSSKTPADCELYIVEGDSAGGSAKQGRNRETQAILPLKGKIINAEKKRLDRLLKNDEIKSMISAMGTGVGEDFDIEGLRYHKIIILTDADVDGAHIRTLLLTFFFRHMKPLIDGGYLYIAQPPLFQLKQGRNEQYVHSDQEKEETLREMDGSPSVQRYKGLGEMNPEQLYETTMKPEKRLLKQVSVDDGVEADQLFETLMGQDVEPRRKFIEQHADEKSADELDI